MKKHLSILAKPFALHLLIWGLFFTAVWSHQLNLTSTGITAGSIASWADGAAHLTNISTFAYRSLIPTTLPVYLGHPFTYPFVTDWISGLLVRLGFPLITAYTWLGLILSLAIVYLLYRFYLFFLHNSWAAFISSAIFLLSGGLGFIWFIDAIINTPHPRLSSLLQPEYTHLDSVHIGWINIITSELLPQRAFLLGLTIGIILLAFCYQLLVKPQVLKFSHWLAAATLYGLLPIIHPHTFIVISFTLAWTFILTLKQSHLYRHWIIFGLVSLPLALALISSFILPGTSSGFIRWYPGWLARSFSINWLWFWLLNWGLFPFAALLGSFFLNRRQRLFLIPALILFVAANLFLFQPYDWDNSKILTYTYLLLSAPAGLLIVRLFTVGLSKFKRHSIKSLALVFLALTLFSILTFSGFLDIIRVLDYSHQSIPMFTRDELQLADWVKTNTPTGTNILTSTTHNHPVPVLTGRQIIMGYPGWLWSYGIDYTDRIKNIQTIYSGSTNALDLINTYHIDYIIIGPTELAQFQPNIEFFTDHFQPVFTNSTYTIYTVN